jgi:hypothetical protein
VGAAGPIAVLILIVASGGAGAQQSQRERTLDEPFRLRMDEQVPSAKRTVFDWGGWFRSSVGSVDDNVDRDLDGFDDGDHTVRRQQSRLWANLSLDQTHQFYARGLLDYWDWNHHDAYDGNDSDWDGPRLERGWYDFQLSRLQAAQGEEPEGFDFGTRIGRQYVEFGTGLALSIPLDAVLVRAYWGDWELDGLLAKSIPSTHNVDRSVPDNSKESRWFWGGQLRYHGWPDHEPFAYIFRQEDQDAGRLRWVEGVLPQSFGYESTYTGLGSRGRFFHPDLQYTTEAVWETGESYASGEVGRREDICAWAFDNELRYFSPGARQSELSAEYLLASGDADRLGSPTNTVGGNRAGSRDHSFVAWGFRDTGLSFAPQMSNLGLLRLGANTYPWPEARALEDLQVGTDFLVYHKQRAGGAASDDLSVKHRCYLGSEIDLYANWRLTSDLAWVVAYGLFFPSEAFPSTNPRQLWFTAVTIDF